MFGLRLISGPLLEPVSLATAKLHLRIDANDTSQDALIAAWITAARIYAEKQTNRAFYPQQWMATLDTFPFWNEWRDRVNILSENPYWSRFVDALSIRLPFPRTLSVDAITYPDTTGAQQTLPASNYSVDSTSEPARVFPSNGSSWPLITVAPAAVQILFTAGTYVLTQKDTLQVTQDQATLSQPFLGMVSLTDGNGNPVTATVSGQNLTVSGSASSVIATYYTPDVANSQIAVAAMLLTIGHLYANREESTDRALLRVPMGVEALLASITHQGGF